MEPSQFVGPASYGTERHMNTNEVIRAFHELYYGSEERTWKNTRWLGVSAQKCPLDLWIYQELIHEIRPDKIIETGTADGGSSLFLASICDLVGNGHVITIDIQSSESLRHHPRLTYISGSSTSTDIVGEVKQIAGGTGSVMVILDSDHTKEHVLKEMDLYSEVVTIGSYLIVEDTNVNGHPVVPNFGPGPMEAIEDFLEQNKSFVIDSERQKFFMTFNPNGFLRKIA
jgi:cephalosporin hydroxylase